MEKRLTNSRYITGFDGIRALAVIAVISYHILPGSMQGGLLGVPIFFVLSGYLITDLLLQEWEQNEDISIKNFYNRRIHRLYPGLVVMLFSVTACITLFQRSLLKNIKSTIFSNLMYVYNWVEIAHHQSYFNNFGVSSPWTHLWSLSIEGQFYLIWPIILLILLRCNFKYKNICIGIATTAVISGILMALLYRSGQDPSRVYYGTDTRLFSILFGVGLAFVWPSTKLKKELKIHNRVILDAIGIISLILIILMFFNMNGETAFMYRGGMFIFSIFSMLLVAAVAHPGADLNRLLTNKLFTWLGKRSYGIYIYQYPVMVFYESRVNVGNHPLMSATIEIALILIISELSYRFVEKPLRRFKFKNTFKVLKARLQNGIKPRQLPLFIVLILFCIASYGMFFCKPTVNSADQKDKVSLQHQIADNQKKTAAHNKKVKFSTKQKIQNKKVLIKNGQITPAGKDFAANLQITGVGDSVMADASNTLQQEFPKIIINAQVGRQANAAPDILQTMKDQQQLASTVLISLGTNGTVSQDTISRIMDIVGSDRNVFWINVHVPTKPWQNDVNDTLQKAQKQYHNLHIIDWYGYSNNKSDWFYADNVHPNENGLKYYGEYILKQILTFYNN
nr:acyltransferase family protein [uncultured Ligilactobacillus sp.]